MAPLRIVIGVAGLALIGLIVWAAFSNLGLHDTFLNQLGVMITIPWGVATLGDLYLGFLLFAVLVFLTERSWWLAVLWAAPVFVIGNVWAVLWFLIRLPHLAKQLSKPDWPTS